MTGEKKGIEEKKKTKGSGRENVDRGREKRGGERRVVKQEMILREGRREEKMKEVIFIITSV